MIFAPLLGVWLSLGPFAESPATVAPPGTTRYSVEIRGHAHETVQLRAVGVPAGFIASFCTPRVCAPFRVTFALPASGRAAIELQLIQNVPGAAKPKTVSVAAGIARASTSFVPAR